MRSLPCVLTLMATFLGCGGKVVVDGNGGTGGSGGAGGGPETTSSSSNASSSSSSSASASSSSSASSSASSSGTGLTCPDAFPGIQAPCADEGQVCGVPLACCNGTAICENGFWRYQGEVCQQDCEPECGPDNFSCLPGAVCVAFIGKSTTYQCQISPCFEDLDCGCADPICEQQGMFCNNIQDGYKVLCDCKGDC